MPRNSRATPPKPWPQNSNKFDTNATEHTEEEKLSQFFSVPQWLILVRLDRVTQHVRVVQVEHDAFFIRWDFLDVGRVRPDHRARPLVGGRGEQFTV
jgi:hypothetical protein